MAATYLVIWGSWVIFGAIVAAGLAWAVRSGQLGQLRRGARVIFDEEEPVGVVTDRFPDHDRSGDDG